MRYINSFDIVCLTETFTDASFVFPCMFDSFDKYISPSIKLSHHGRSSGGVVVFVKKRVNKCVKEIKTDCENLVVLRLSRQLLGTPKDVLYISVYIPPYGSPFYEQTESSCHILELERIISDLLADDDDVHLFCNGDFNGRTGNSQVQNVTPTHTNSYDIFDKTDTFIQNRNSDDLVTNDFGRKLLDMCACFNLKILNGCPEFCDSGGFTYFSDHGHSVVDYFLLVLTFAIFLNICLSRTELNLITCQSNCIAVRKIIM